MSTGQNHCLSVGGGRIVVQWNQARRAGRGFCLSADPFSAGVSVVSQHCRYIRLNSADRSSLSKVNLVTTFFNCFHEKLRSNESPLPPHWRVLKATREYGNPSKKGLVIIYLANLQAYCLIQFFHFLIFISPQNRWCLCRLRRSPQTIAADCWCCS